MFRFSRILACFAFLAATLMATCCNNPDLNEIQEQLRQHELEIQNLKQLVQAANNDVKAVQTAVMQMKNGGYVTSVTPNEENGTVVGYTITFGSGDAIYVKTEDYEMPTVCARASVDNRYYWTINDEWLLDDDGNMIAADNASPTPMLTMENGKWYVSVNGGESWVLFEKEPNQGQPFKSIDTSNPNYVVITLANGTVLQLATWSAYISLKNLVNQLNNNVSALRRVVSALEERDYLISASPFVIDGQQGYILEFAKSGQIIVYSVSDGQDSPAPSIVFEDGSWWVSSGVGGDYVQLSDATEAGSIATGIDTSNDSFVRIILSDGSTLDIPRRVTTTLQVNLPQDIIELNLDETISFSYEIAGTCAEGAVVTAFSDGNFVTMVDPNSSTSGVITVKCTSVYQKGYITILVTDTSGYTITQILHFESYETPTPEVPVDVGDNPFDVNADFYCSTRLVTVPTAGGSSSFEVKDRFGLCYSFPTNNWVTFQTSQISNGHYMIIATATENPYREDRYHTLYVNDIGSVLIKQPGNENVPVNPYWSKEYVLLDDQGSEVQITVTSSVSSLHMSYAPWIKIQFGQLTDGGKARIISIGAEPNTGLENREGEIAIDVGDARGIIRVSQLPKMRL